jgi:hypothetical protein
VKNENVLEYLKRQAINRGANALINLKVTYYKKFVPPSPPPVSRRTPLDFVPGYAESQWRKHAKPLHKEMPIYRVEAVVVAKEGTRNKK